MNILKQTRKRLFRCLNQKIKGVDRYLEGRPQFIADESELPAIAVYIEEARPDEQDICGTHWEIDLNVVAYHKSMTPEDDIDDVLERITTRLKQQSFDEWENLTLVQCSYVHDEQQSQWIAGVLHYRINLYTGEDDDE